MMKRLKSEKSMVSVIVPVYETEEYVAQCLESIIGQTYSDLEIILVVAESKDSSAKICEEYSKKDHRIRIINQAGKGVGNARNQGVSDSNGEYICFVDSDDWIKPAFVERMLRCLLEDESDFVECDYLYGENGDERIGGNSQLSRLSNDILQAFGAPACWKQMYKKSFWVKERIGFTNTIAEDLFLYSDIYGVSKKRSFLREPLYCYRIRSDSMFHTDLKSATKYEEIIELFKKLVEKSKERDLFDNYSETIYRMLSQHSCMHFRSICSRIEDAYAESLRNLSYRFFANTFLKSTNSFNRRVVSFGGYNLGRIANYISPDGIEDIRYSFSSIISVMSPKSEDARIEGKNSYRQSMIDKDTEASFVKRIGESKIDLILIDFTEERFDIIKYGNSFYTKSDAIDKFSFKKPEYTVIPRDTEECDSLWKDACERLIDVFESLEEKCKIVLVETYLSECEGNAYKRKSNSDKDVQLINSRLQKYYRYFEERCKKAIVIKWSEVPEYLKYTDETFEHGVLPEHLNKYYYCYVANLIFDCID